MGDEAPEQPAGPARSKLASALTASIRRTGDKGTVVGRLVTAGLAVVLTCAVALAVGAVIAHQKSTGTTKNVAAEQAKSASPLRKSGTPSLVPTRTRPYPLGPNGVPIQPGGPRQAQSSPPHPTSGGPRKQGSQKMAASSVAKSTIVSYDSNRCIDVTGEGRVGVALQIWQCGPIVDWKLWGFYPDRTVRSMGKCMTVGGSANGAPIVLEPCNGGASQRFQLKSSLDLVNIAADKCVDVKDHETGNGTPLQLWDCVGTSNQKWHRG